MPDTGPLGRGQAQRLPRSLPPDLQPCRALGAEGNVHADTYIDYHINWGGSLNPKLTTRGEHAFIDPLVWCPNIVFLGVIYRDKVLPVSRLVPLTYPPFL